MSRYLNAIAEATNTIRVQRWTIGVLGAVALMSLIGWRTRDTHLTMHIPPDLTNGATLKVGGKPDVPPPNVYTFGFYVWQQINNWQRDGNKDYGQQIYDYQWYITPACRQQLEADMRNKSDAAELIGRTRTIMEIAGQGFTPNRVITQGGDTWTVIADVMLNETIKGMAVKTTYIRYPLRVVRYDVNMDKNPWGLAIDCFGNRRPERLDVANIKVPANNAPAVLPQPAGTTGTGTQGARSAQ